MGIRAPFETFKGATCKGCYALGTQCGHCEKCAWERQQSATVTQHPEPVPKVDLSPAEELVMRQAFKATMLRAASIIDALTDEDVADAQMALFETGTNLGLLHKVDRALIASCHLRACVELEFGFDERVRAEMILKDLRSKI